MLSEARNTTASKKVALDAFKVFLQVTGRASLEQLLLNREESCSLSLFADYAEHLYAYKQPRNQQNYQPKVQLQYLSTIKEHIRIKWPDHPLWVNVNKDDPHNWYTKLRAKLEDNSNRRCIQQGVAIVEKSIPIGREILRRVCIELMKKNSLSGYTERFVLCLTLSAVGRAGTNHI